MKNKFVLFGATGDLAKTKLLPALLRLNGFDSIICIGRRNLDTAAYFGYMGIELYPKKFLGKVKYIRHDLQMPMPDLGAGNMVFYLATPPNLFERITELLEHSDCLRMPGFKRVVYEKPFGRNLASAQSLNKCIRGVFAEDQIYRIDHFLGKELVQSIIAFRFANSLLSETWNSEHVEEVHITLAETLGVGMRGGYYDQSGAVRDMVQNHMMQLLSLIAMETPKTLSADNIRSAKAQLLRRAKVKKARFGQYVKGVIEGHVVDSYEKDIGHKSQTETYAELEVAIDTKRWKGVPFVLRSGKRLHSKVSEVNLILRDVSCRRFCADDAQPNPNTITIRIAPIEGLVLQINAKTPGPKMAIEPVNLEFCHACKFGPATPQAYEMLLSQVLAGDQTLFARWDEVVASWRIVEPLLGKKKLFRYAAGTMPGTNFKN